ncbi:MAG TPA: methyltransferase domain-containing protein [Terriglobales bacterium]
MGASQSASTLESVNFHADLAAGWEERYAKKSFRARIAVLEECLRDEELAGSNWLDAGCGTGTLSRWLAAHGCQVLGVDAAASMVTAAEKLSQDWSIERLPKFARVETIACLAAEDASFDGILCSSVLEYVEQPDRCLTEFARILKPGGALLVSVPNRDSMVRKGQVASHRLGVRIGQNWLPFIRHSHHQYGAREFGKLLSQSGFVVESTIPFGSPLPSFIQRLPFGGSLLMFKASKIEHSQGPA